ncbi:hypothetical protein [Pyxidicoccus caerfyrddinensis]|uniref:hypothetical protein n=1 Tax=Pyxidicoccus caerfyrddinensis TaxID=2709663 RepID=UPI0013DC7FA3|nr:hypothetical protein [Pyxidicoccus caerfyrddinensis]
MAKPLRLFINPPFVAPTPWTRVHGYGPAPSTPGPQHAFRDHLRLRTTDTGQLLAVMAGTLSARPPLGGAPDPTEPFDLPEDYEPLPPRVKLYLHPSFVMTGAQAFQQRAQQLGGLRGFIYLDIETGSLEAALAEQLDFLIPNQGLNRARVVDLLIRGQVDVPVTAGHAIGRAAPVAGQAGTREVGFSVLTFSGTTDPSHLYDVMRDFVEEGQPKVDELLTLAPRKWPVIDAATPAALLGLVQASLYPFSVLKEAKDRLHLTAAQWRQVGNHQKALYREQLLKRAGHAPAGSTAPPFEFNDRDALNLFQLEAIVEFYSLFDDPWLAGAVPGTPTAATTIDFLDPEGAAATAAGNQVTLDGTMDLSRVRAGKDLLYLDADTARPRKWYRITAVDVANRQVTLEAGASEPNLGGNPSPWRISLRQVLVLIDPLGGRLQGASATRTADNTVRLDGTPNINKLNARFDTVYLPSDTARPRRTYRITAFDRVQRTLTLDGNPDFGGGTSAWHIPAGLSGELPALAYDLGPAVPATPANPRFYDHYDGVMFVVHNGEVHAQVRYTSFTSRNYPANDQNLSSVRGNRRYHWASYRSPGTGSGPQFRNYTFTVVDPDVTAYDGLREARFYFGEHVTEDVPEAGHDPQTSPTHGGKVNVRIHRGTMSGQNTGTGSAGCLVSPLHNVLRDYVIDRYQVEQRALNGVNDANIQALRGQNWAQTQTTWAANSVTWDNRIVGTLWVIRPDELPLS